MKGQPSAKPSWTLRIIGLVLIIAALAASPWIWKSTKAVLPKYRENKTATWKVRLATLKPLAAPYGGALVAIIAGVWLLRRSGKTTAAPLKAATPVPEAKVETPLAPKPPPRPTHKRWHDCNVLNVGLDANRLWEFDVSGGKLKLDREQTVPAGQSLPHLLINKSWRTLWQPRLNVAWLPADSVFLRVIQLPESSPEETWAMVELQLEKLSPIPVTQAVWTASRIGQPTGTKLQTLIVILAERKAVEQFLGQLEGQGFLADRLELPVLDQLEATEARQNGAYIYPGVWSGRNNALVAWWYNGTLQNINFVVLPDTEDRMAGFREQLNQMAWAGELEGWLTGPPAWHLVADAATAAEWEESLRQRLGETVETFLSLTPTELAARTARRAASPDAKASLMPPEFATRYQQQFVDRLWLHALLAIGASWVIYVIIYMLSVTVLDYHTRSVEQAATDTSLTYTNTIELKAKLDVLRERQELKYAVLDCWQAVAETVPEVINVESFSFSDGRLTLNGTAPGDQNTKVTDFNVAMRRWTVNGAPLFDVTGGDTPGINQNPNNPTLSWRFGLELKRVEVQ